MAAKKPSAALQAFATRGLRSRSVAARELGDDAAGDEDDERRRARRASDPQVAAGQGRAATEGDVVGEIRRAQHDATRRLLMTARTTGRGAFRNWRQRMSAQDRRRAVAADRRTRTSAISVLADDRQARLRRQCLRRVRGEQLDGAGEPLDLRLAVEEADADPDRVERPGSSGRSRTRARRARRAPPRPASRAMRNETSVAIRSRGVSSSTPGIAARRSAAARARAASRSRGSTAGRRTSTASRSSGPCRRPKAGDSSTPRTAGRPAGRRADPRRSIDSKRTSRRGSARPVRPRPAPPRARRCPPGRAATSGAAIA